MKWTVIIRPIFSYIAYYAFHNALKKLGVLLGAMCMNISVYLGLLSYNMGYSLNPLAAKLFNLNFHPLQVVSRLRDPQLQVSENYSDLTKWRSTVFKYS